MRSYIFLTAILANLFLFTCKKPVTNSPGETATTFFAKGADISWITEMEAAGKRFYDTTGQQQDLFTLLRSYSLNTVRLRVWVNPSNGWNAIPDLLAKAARAKSAGMRIMIDFHYSDSWADPGQQTKPASWQSANFTGLKDSLRDHTVRVLQALKANGITPDWIQVGNETNDGMLWPDGKASVNMTNFAELIKAGYTAAKTVFPAAKVIVHISNGWDNSLFRWIFDGLKANNVDWDVIGMSLYPTASNWQSLDAQCLANMNDMVSRYGKEVMIVEVGMSWDQPANTNYFLADIIAKTKAVAQKKGIGVLYWEPEAYNWQNYTLGCFDLAGKPTMALNAFR